LEAFGNGGGFSGGGSSSDHADEVSAGAGIRQGTICR
jgi:hypothetical protein